MVLVPSICVKAFSRCCRVYGKNSRRRRRDCQAVQGSFDSVTASLFRGRSYCAQYDSNRAHLGNLDSGDWVA